MALDKEWVNSKYTNELAVVFGWLGLFIPWNFVHTSLPEIETVLVHFRFGLLEVAYGEGVVVEDGIRTLFVTTARSMQAGQDVQLAYTVWILGSVLLSALFLYSTALYFREEKVESLVSFAPARIVGSLYVSIGVVFTVVTALLYTYGLPGIPIPIGTLVFFVFGFILLTNKIDAETEPGENEENN